MQNDPVPNELPQIADLVIADVDQRRKLGIRTYGAPLQPLNGRRALQDLYEELLDAAHYTRQRIEEEDLALASVTADPNVVLRMQDIRTSAARIAQHPSRHNKEFVVKTLTEGVQYLGLVIDRLVAACGTPPVLDAGVLANLDRARGTIGCWPPVEDEEMELAGYQYRANHADGPLYDSSYTEESCSDPSNWAGGWWPEVRPLYGGPWALVGPQGPPEQPVGGWTVPRATGDVPVAERVPEGPPADPQDPSGGVLLGSVLGQIRRGCGLTQQQLLERLDPDWTLSRLTQIENFWLPVPDGEVSELCEAMGVQTPELVGRLYRLAALSRSQTECPECEHVPATHTRTIGCMRCQCSYKREDEQI